MRYNSKRVSELEQWKRRVEKVLGGYKAGVSTSATSYAEIQSRLQHVTTPSGSQELRIKEDFEQTMFPFVPDHKDITRRLVNGIFMNAERVGTNVRGHSL